MTPQVPVAFTSRTMAPTETRTGLTGNMTDTELRSQGFGVMAYYTSSTEWSSVGDGNKRPNFMYNQWVRYFSDVQWTYEPIKYWPNDNQPADDEDATGSQEHSFLSFFAYAPYVEVTPDTGIPASGPLTTGITGLSTNAETGNPLVHYTLASQASEQVDLLWGARGQSAYAEADGTSNTESSITNTDLTKQTTTERVSFLFKHALACIDIYVQRIYDEVTYSGKTPDTDAAKIFVSELKLSMAAGATNASGDLDLSTGTWTSVTPNAAAAELVISSDKIATDLRGTTEENSNLTAVRNIELDGFDDKEGVDETRKRLTTTDYATMLIPRTGGVTVTPSVSYSFVTADPELALNITDSKGTPYSRILHHDVQSEPSTVTIASAGPPVRLEGGKRYTLVCYIGVEHVAFEVVSVEDWDFPLRFDPSVTDFANPYNESTGENGTSKTLNED
ncbi:MAG: fimbrillin family protein [Bacteroidaceae bacterium]|nr:fimbrillin family protein [Bacteroidaceae bacterium]